MYPNSYEFLWLNSSIYWNSEKETKHELEGRKWSVIRYDLKLPTSWSVYNKWAGRILRHIMFGLWFCQHRVFIALKKEIEYRISTSACNRVSSYDYKKYFLFVTSWRQCFYRSKVFNSDERTSRAQAVALIGGWRNRGDCSQSVLLSRFTV